MSELVSDAAAGPDSATPRKAERPRPARWRIKAFLSYDRTDTAIAKALQAGLQRFAKPFYRLRAFQVFRDETDLLIGQALLPSIKQALTDSEFLLLLASPESAGSDWVKREIETWLDSDVERRAKAEKIIFVLTDGEIAWNWDSNDFDWDRTTALPRLFSRMYQQEPQYLDLGWARMAKPEDLSLANDRFRSAVASLAAPLHNRTVGEIAGEEARQHRITKWAIRLALLILTVSTAVAGWQWWRAEGQRAEALLQRDLAETQTKNALHLRNAALRNLDLAQRNLYAANIALAREAWERGNCQRSLEVLDLEGPKPGVPDRRGFEWFHLRRRCNGEIAELPSFLSQGRMAFSPDGRWLLTHDLLFEVGAWVERGQVGDLGVPGGGAFSGDGRLLAYGGHIGKVKLRDLDTGRESVVLEGLPGGGYAWPVAFSADARWLAAGAKGSHEGDIIRLLDRQTGATRTLGDETLRIYSVAISPDGRRIAAGWGKGNFRNSLFGNLTVWDLSAGSPSLRFTSPDQRGWVTAVAFSPNGKLLASSDANGAIKLWRADTGREIAELPGHEGLVSALAFRDSETLISSGWDGTLRIRDVEKRIQDALVRNRGLVIHALALGLGGRLAATADLEAVRVWNLTEEPGRTILSKAHPGEVNSLAFSPDGLQLASASSDDSAIRVWDILSGRGREFRDRIFGASSVAFSADARFLVAAVKIGIFGAWRLNLWDLRQPANPPRAFGEGSRTIAALASSPQRGQVAACRLDGTILVQDLSGRSWTLTTGKPLLLCTLTFSRDGKLLAWGETGGTVQVWSATEPSGSPLHQRSYDFEVSSLAFAPDGTRLAVALGTHHDEAKTGKLSVWNFKTGDERSTSVSHEGSLTSIAFSPDGRSLATGSWDATVRLWDPLTLREILVLREHESPVFSLAFAPVGQTLAAGHQDGTIALWQGAAANPIRRSARESTKRVEVPKYLTPLSEAAREGDLAKVSALLKAGEDPNARSGHTGQTALHWAIIRDDIKLIRLLLEHGANPNLESSLGTFPLVFAANSENSDIVKLLLRHRAKPNVQDPSGDTPLKSAAQMGLVQNVAALLAAGANPNFVPAKDRITAVHGLMMSTSCPSQSHLQILEMLIRAGADCSIPGSNGATPLTWAIQNNCPKFAARLIQCGAKVDGRFPNGDTFLQRARELGSRELIELLQKPGASSSGL